ncbi:protein DNA-DAMAGE INDUCIBLE 1-like [Camellia sinensis]|uniref:protein DNA-DAMAGE INDUCIBLE 1-like n=1 Tax=Camellia sinensis TaxID=4442 RepID=UPI0010356C32|nr:protein DNA-DAMAGE INDUCIBLE 1-like [Camellia sinensis]
MQSRRSGKGSKAAGSRVGAFHMMNAMEKKASTGRPKKNAKSGKVGKHSDPKQLVESKDEGKGKKPLYSGESSSKLNKSKSSKKGLMFVDVKLNGKPLRALIDTGATHNFVAGTEVERLGLSLEKDGSRSKKGLMFVDVKLNGKPLRALIDTGATHNFVAGTEVEGLGLSLEKDDSHIKAVNSAAQPIYGVTKSIHLKVSTQEGRVDFTAVPMDDFQAILGLDFLRSTKTAVMPYSNSMCVMRDKPRLVPAMATNNSDRFVSAMQLKRGVRHGEQTWIVALKLNEALKSTLVLTIVKKVLRQFEDVMPEQLPKDLPQRQGVNHAIELVPGAKPLARAPYRMAILELNELRK